MSDHQTTRTLSVNSAETLRLIDCWNFGSDDGTVDQVVLPSVTLYSDMPCSVVVVIVTQ